SRAIPHPRALLLDQRSQLATLPREDLDPGRRQPRVGRVAHVCLEHRRVDPHRTRPEAPLPRGLHDQRARQLAHGLGTDPPRELAAAPSPRPATRRPTGTPAAPPRASACTPLSIRNPLTCSEFWSSDRTESPLIQ